MRWVLSGAFFLFGMITLDTSAWGWALLGSVLFFLPLVLQCTPWSALRYGALWLGIFLTGQTMLSILLDNDYKTLPPYVHQTIDVKGGLPGIQGVQHITTDHRGFRVTRPINYEDEKPFRIFALGGSTTAQVFLDDHKTWTHLLQEKLRQHYQAEVEVINTGVSGLRMRHHLATLKQILPYKPDMVLFLVGVNDWNWHVRETFGGNLERQRRRWFFSNTMLGKIFNMVYVRVEADTGTVRPEYGASLTRQRGSLQRPTQYHFMPTQVYPEYQQALQQASALCRKAAVACVFVTQPSGYQPGASEAFKAGFWATPSEQEYTLDFDSLRYIAGFYNTYLMDFATTNRHSYCDLAARIAPSYEYFYDDCHFNEHGATVVAEVLFTCLTAYMERLPKRGAS
jgi:hypothetical protein